MIEPRWRPVWRFIFAILFVTPLLITESRHVNLPARFAIPYFVLALPVQELSGTAIAAGCRAASRWWARRKFGRAIPRAIALR